MKPIILFCRLHRTVYIVVISILCSIPAIAQWKQCNGPFGGFVTKLTAHNSSVFAVVVRDNYTNRDSVGLFRSTDNGKTWVQLSTDFGKAPNKYMALISNENMLIAQFHEVIYCSTDNGDTWTGKPGYYDHPIICIGKVFYTWLSGGDFFSSSDYGLTWSRICTSVPLPYGEYLRPTLLTLSSNGKDFISGTFNKGIFISKDKGITWTESNVGLTDLTVLEVAVSGQMLYASTKSGLFRSSDDGQTWTLVKSTPPNTWAPYNILTIAGGTLFFMSELGVYRSTDLGNSWLEIEKKNTQYQIKPQCHIGTILFGSSENGIFRSSDNGDTWISVGVTNQSVNSIIKNGTSLYAGTNQNGVYRSNNNGLSWTSVNSSLTPKFTNASYSFRDTLYLGTESGVYRSWNNGDTLKFWTMQDYSIKAFTSNEKTLFIASDKYLYVYKSEKDTSGVWNTKTRLNSQNIRTLTCFGTNIFAGISPGGIFRSIDDGNTWTKVNSFSPKTIVVSGTTLFAISNSENRVYRSNDKGETWTPRGNFYGPVTAIFVNDKTIYVGTNFWGVYSSNDYGDTWEEVAKKYVAPDVQSIFIDNSTLYAGSFLSSVWKIEIPVSIDKQSQLENNNSLPLCYPNPATNSITVNHTSPLFNSAIPIQYTITSMTGEALLETENTEPQFSISTEFLASGVYFLTARQGLQRSSTLFSILH